MPSKGKTKPPKAVGRAKVHHGDVAHHGGFGRDPTAFNLTSWADRPGMPEPHEPGAQLKAAAVDRKLGLAPMLAPGMHRLGMWSPQASPQAIPAQNVEPKGKRPSGRGRR